MKPLLKNDLMWAGPLGIAGLVIYVLTFCSHTPQATWIVPDVNGGAMALGFGGIAATVLGLVAGLVEDVTRTREYLLHRPVSVERVFWTRHALGLAIVVAWLVLGPLLHLLGSHLFSANAPLLDDGRLPMIVGFGLPALLGYALGVWVASFSRTVIGGTLLLAVIGLPLSLALFTGVLLTPTVFGVVVVLISLALTPLLLLGALAAVRAGRDPDRPWSLARLRRAGPVAALVVILAGSLAATLLEIGANGGLLSLYPMAGESEQAGQEGQVMLYRHSRWDSRHHQTDQQHRLGPVMQPSWKPRMFEPMDDAWRLEESGHVRHPGFPHRGRYFRGVLYAPAFMSTAEHQVFLGSDGFVHLYALARDDGPGDDRPRYARLGKGPQNLPFSPRTKRAGGIWEQVGALYDPADGGLWLYDARSGAAGFHRVELPGGDRFVTSDWVRYYIPPGMYRRPPPLSPLFVWGERGRYALNDQGQFAPVAADENTMPAPTRAEHVTLRSPTSFTATVTSDDGKTLFTHEYRPYTLAEKATAAFVYAPALLRPPLTSAPSLLTPERKAHDLGRLLLDPAVARAGQWLVPANLLVAIALALLAHRRLGRLGVTGGRRRFWVVVVVAGGLPGYLCQRLVETRRAWQPLPAADKAVATPILMIANLPPVPAVRPA
jgi:hypothetical protein